MCVHMHMCVQMCVCAHACACVCVQEQGRAGSSRWLRAGQDSTRESQAEAPGLGRAELGRTRLGWAGRYAGRGSVGHTGRTVQPGAVEAVWTV